MRTYPHTESSYRRRFSGLGVPIDPERRGARHIQIGYKRVQSTEIQPWDHYVSETLEEGNLGVTGPMGGLWGLVRGGFPVGTCQIRVVFNDGQSGRVRSVQECGECNEGREPTRTKRFPTLERTCSASILGTHYIDRTMTLASLTGAGRVVLRIDDDSYVYNTFDWSAAIIAKRQDGQVSFGVFYSLWRVSGEYAGKPK